MRLNPLKRPAGERGSVLLYFVFAVVVISLIAQVSTYVVQTARLTHRRVDMFTALQFAEGGSSIGAFEYRKAFTNVNGALINNLLTNAAGNYVKNTSLSAGSLSVYERTVSAPFTNQTVKVQLWATNFASPSRLQVVSVASVNGLTHTNYVTLEVSYGQGAAIISDNKGTITTGIGKSDAQKGNVAITAGKKGKTVIDGEVIANGSINVDAYVTLPNADISEQRYGTSIEIPDYTNPGSSNQLFDFNRFIAVANATSNHFTNLSSFVTAAKTGTVLEGVIVVDIATSGLPALSPSTLPNGINIRGTLVFNFSTNYVATDKVVNTAVVNINPANLSAMVPGNPATYTTGYPPTFTNPAKDPSKADITGKGFANFQPGDDLPALMYNNAILDIHGPVNICGVVYSPAFMEIENKVTGATQYFNGSLITGNGVIVDNDDSISIVTYDKNAMDFLATSGTKSKVVKAVAWY